MFVRVPCAGEDTLPKQGNLSSLLTSFSYQVFCQNTSVREFIKPIRCGRKKKSPDNEKSWSQPRQPSVLSPELRQRHGQL